MELKTIQQIKNLKNERVILRTGFDVPRDSQGRIKDDTRIRQSLPTIRYLVKKGVKVIIISHSGRPAGQRVRNLSLGPIARRLSKLLEKKVVELENHLAEKYIDKMKAGEIVLLENLRFDPGEEKNNLKFAQKLARLGDIYINDAFSNSHRQHASMVGITRYLVSYAGLALEEEVKNLSQFIEKPRRPAVAVIGGAKIFSKLNVVEVFLKKFDYVLLGGALANSVLKAKGEAVGKSVVEPRIINQLKKLPLTSLKLKIPVDVVVARKNYTRIKFKAVGEVSSQELILDIGRDTIQLYVKIIRKAKTIVTAGPMGMFEKKKFSYGSKSIFQAMTVSRAKTLAGGGDTLRAIASLSQPRKFTYLSSGGSAMLEFLEKGTLPALKPLKKY